MINVGIVGGTGYTAGELMRLLVFHPEVNINWVYSRTNAGKKITDIHPDVVELASLEFVDNLDWKIDLVFLCMPHGTVRSFLEENPGCQNVKTIDLSNEFRLGNSEGYVYGLPELNRKFITGASRIANPGCFATCIQLALLPMADQELLDQSIHVTAITGSTGAGKSLSPTTHFSWRTSNLSVYKAFTHQHLPEVKRSLCQLQNNFDSEINFVPMRGNFTRGIIASIYFNTELSQEEAFDIYQKFYSDHPFISISDIGIDMKLVVNTNRALISVNVIDNKLHLVSSIDNLLKGASGQAVQNMNLMFGYPEMEGLKLKSIAY